MNQSRTLLPVAILLVAFAVAMAGVGASSADKNGCPNANSANGASHANDSSAHGANKQRDRDCAAATPTNIATPAEDPTPTVAATPDPTPAPTAEPTPEPTPGPTPEPTAAPPPDPTPVLTPTATPEPTPEATPEPTPTPERTPTPMPTIDVEVVSLELNGASTGSVGVPFQLTGQANVRNNAPSLAAIIDTTFTPTLPVGCTATTGIVTVQNTAIPAGASASLSRSWMITCTQAGLQTFGMSATSALDPVVLAVDDNMANNTRVTSRDIQVN